MEFSLLSSDQQVLKLIEPILKILQDAGGELTRNQLRDWLLESDESIAEFAETVQISKKSGKAYKSFNFRFNFAINELIITGFIRYGRTKQIIRLTQQGLSVKLNQFDPQRHVHKVAKLYWKEKDKERKSKEKTALGKDNLQDDFDDEEQNERILPHDESNVLDEVKVKLQEAIKAMSPDKFEQFSRQLLTKMGVTFTEKGVKRSNDGGIDGYGYHMGDDFRATRVVIQCKRYTDAAVGEPDVNQFLGAMNKYQADYGVFITSSRFTQKAREAAREGSPITLIDGNDLIELIIKYELYITPVTTYVLDEFYYE